MKIPFFYRIIFCYIIYPKGLSLVTTRWYYKVLQGPPPAITHVWVLMLKEKALANLSFLIFYVSRLLLKEKLKRILFKHYINSSFIFSDAPTCVQNQPKIYGVAKQEEAQIKCIVDANPQDVDFSWTFNNSAESIDVATNHIFRLGNFLNDFLITEIFKYKIFL